MSKYQKSIFKCDGEYKTVPFFASDFDFSNVNNYCVKKTEGTRFQGPGFQVFEKQPLKPMEIPFCDSNVKRCDSIKEGELYHMCLDPVPDDRKDAFENQMICALPNQMIEGEAELFYTKRPSNKPLTQVIPMDGLKKVGSGRLTA